MTPDNGDCIDDAGDLGRRLEVTRVGLERALLAWGSGSVLAGLGLAAAGRGARRSAWVAAGRQHVVWGGVDAALGAWGRQRRRSRRASTRPDVGREARDLRRLLVLNIGLDAGYVAVGTALALAPGRVPGRRPDRVAATRATGLAVVVQGAFLLIVDARAAARLGPDVGPSKRS